MRNRFNQGNELDAIRIGDVELVGPSRHQLHPLLVALQYIFVTPELNEGVFSILEEKIKRVGIGRRGMSHWEILVLGVVRLNLNIDYDFLLDQANCHIQLRGILGIGTKNVFKKSRVVYKLQTMKDNVCLLDEETLMKISEVVAKAGHGLLKKKEEDGVSLEVKADTYVVEKNVHFPTDLNLKWDSGRKCLECVGKIIDIINLAGLREHKSMLKKLKCCYRDVSEIHRKKGANYQDRLIPGVKKYIQLGKTLLSKINANWDAILEIGHTPRGQSLVLDLFYYMSMLDKHIDLVDRRLLKGEKIPHHEKVFSIFEPDVEWISKGKHHKRVELGHRVLVCTDQFHFIIDHAVAIGQVDSALPIPLKNRLLQKFGADMLESISFDRGFYSRKAKVALEEVFDKVVMPKPGKKSKAVSAEEAEARFIKLKNRHSAVESNINELEHAGLDKVLDKGTESFKRYVALGVLAYNLKRLGKILVEQEGRAFSIVTAKAKAQKAA